MVRNGYANALALVAALPAFAFAQAPSVQTASPDPNHPILSAAFNADVDRVTGSPLTRINRFRLLENGASAFPEKLNLVRNARHSVLFTTMVAGWDTTARQFADELVAAAQRGVQVRCILDGQRTDPRFARRLNRGGVKVATWNSFVDFSRAGRIHKKVVVADLSRAVTGGMNMKDEYNLGDGVNTDHYLDTDILVEGEGATLIARGFLGLYQELEPRDVGARALSAIANAVVTPIASGHVGAARYVLQDSDKGDLFVDDYYKRCFDAAREQIVWHVHAIIGNDPLSDAVKDAAARGVNVIFLTSSLKADQDRLGWLIGYFKYHGGRLLFRRKFRGSGVQVYEMDIAIHSKVVTVDGVMASVGSYNFSTSVQKNIENAFVVHDPNLVRDVEDMFQRHLAQAKRVRW
jgi:cardiolipin synthase